MDETIRLLLAVHPADQGRIVQLPGISATTLINREMPQVGDRFTHPNLVDPQTREPCEVIVAMVLPALMPGYTVVVLSRAQ